MAITHTEHSKRFTDSHYNMVNIVNQYITITHPQQIYCTNI